MTPKQRAALIQTATRLEAERNRNARTPKETPAMKNKPDYEPEPEKLRWDGLALVVALIVIALLATGVVPIGK